MYFIINQKCHHRQQSKNFLSTDQNTPAFHAASLVVQCIYITHHVKEKVEKRS